VMGLSAAGVTSGLAALGLGLGMVPGIGIAIVIGTGIFIGMKYLFGDSKKEKERKLSAENERKAQLVIKNLQDTINELLKRISSLEPKAAESEANQKAIQVLRERLNSLKRILEQRKQQLVTT
jgi:peptidoglycan hydrolase CwlO-like protein